MKTGILFDLDGTLLDSLEDLTDSVNYTLRHFGCPERSLDEVRSFVGNGAKVLITLALPGKESDPSVEEALRFFQTYYADHCQLKTRPYDGILEALTELRKEFPVAVVSNKPDVATKPLCKGLFGEDIYALGQIDDCPRKPAPDMVFAAMKAIGADACIYVGDSDVDVKTAQNAGVPCLSVLWGFRGRDFLTEQGATHFCEDPKDLVTCLKEMIANG